MRHRPVSGPAPGLAGLSCSSSPPKGRAERQGVSPRPRRPHGLDAGSPHAAFAAHERWSSPTPKIVEPNRASEADLRLRSAREWILRLAACPRGCHWRRRAPVRASCRPDMHLDRPPVLPASVPVRFLRIAILTASRVRHRSGHPHPAPRIEDDRHAPLTGAGCDRRYKSYREDQEQNANKRQLFFLRIRKALSAATTPKVAPAWLNLNSSRFNRLVVLLDAGGGAELFRGAVPGYNSSRWAIVWSVTCESDGSNGAN